MQNSPKVLKVVSIIMIIGGVLSIILSFPQIPDLLAAAAMAGSLGASGASLLIIFGVILTVVICIVQLCTAVIGLLASNGKVKVKTAYLFGIIMLALAAVSILYSIVGSAFGISSIFGLVLPVLYFVSANQMKKDAEAAAAMYPPMNQNFQ